MGNQAELNFWIIQLNCLNEKAMIDKLKKHQLRIRQAAIDDSKIILDCIRGLAEHVNQLHEVSATELR